MARLLTDNSEKEEKAELQRFQVQKKKTVRKKKIANLLRKALLQDGKMERSLYEYELKEHIDYWYEGLKADRDEFVFAVTENSGDVAMVLSL